MKTTTQCLAILPLIVGFDIRSAEAVQYMSQQRYVYGLVGWSSDVTTVQHDAPDVGVFADEVHLQYDFLSGHARSDITQSSTLNPLAIVAFGTASGSGSGSNPPAGSIARTLLNTHFLVSGPTEFQLDGSLAWAAFGGLAPPSPPALWVRLDGPTGMVFNMQRAATNVGSLSFSGSNAITGILPVGEYTLEAWIDAGGGGGSSAQGSFNFTLAVPSPGTGIVLGAASLALVHRRRRAPR
jgi:hypothetical protein